MCVCVCVSQIDLYFFIFNGFVIFIQKLYSNAVLIKRPSKAIKSPYIADIIIDNEEELAHCPY